MAQKYLMLTLVLMAFAPSTAAAAFVANHADWKKAQPVLQELYLVGVMDGWTGASFPGELPWMKALRTGVNKCMFKQEINARMLVGLVNQHYEAHPADWRVMPAVVLREAITGVCLADINKERDGVGLIHWERKSGQISSDR